MGSGASERLGGPPEKAAHGDGGVSVGAYGGAQRYGRGLNAGEGADGVAERL